MSVCGDKNADYTCERPVGHTGLHGFSRGDLFTPGPSDGAARVLDEYFWGECDNLSWAASQP